MSDSAAASLRIFPEDWIHPFDVQSLFNSPQPLHVDVGCGKGRFLLARAEHHPEMNFFGIDRMLRRVRKIDRKAQRRNLLNIRLFRCDAYYALMHLLPSESVDLYTVFFPDPWPKERHHKYRFFDAPFVDALHRTMKEGAVCHFATDHWPYYEEVRDLIAKDDRFAPEDPFVPEPDEKTDFELMFIDTKPIGRCSFRKK